MKNFLLGVFTALVVVIGGGYLFLRSGFANMSADAPGSQIESYIRQTAIRASIERNATAERSPVPPTEVNLVTGGKMYMDQCASCHGMPGRKAGESATARQFLAAGTAYTESQVFWVAKHGIRGTSMASNGDRNSDEELWAIAAYVKRMNKLPQHVKDELAKQAQMVNSAAASY